MDFESIRSELQEFLEREAGISRDLLGDGNVELIESGILDSFEIVRIISFLEKNFGISIDNNEVRVVDFSTLNGIVDLVVAHKARQ